MPVNKQRLQLGLEALRSGEFKQCTGQLRSASLDISGDGKHEVRYCCLGVLTEVAVRNGLAFDTEVCVTCGIPADSVIGKHANCIGQFTSSLWEVTGEVLPKAVMDWYGIVDSDPIIASLPDDDATESPEYETFSATECNDDKNWDFEQIADAFEATFITDDADKAA